MTHSIFQSWDQFQSNSTLPLINQHLTFLPCTFKHRLLFKKQGFQMRFPYLPTPKVPPDYTNPTCPTHFHLLPSQMLWPPKPYKKISCIFVFWVKQESTCNCGLGVTCIMSTFQQVFVFFQWMLIEVFQEDVVIISTCYKKEKLYLSPRWSPLKNIICPRKSTIISTLNIVVPYFGL